MHHEEDLARESKRQKLEFAVQNRASVAAIPVGLYTGNSLVPSTETGQMLGKPLSGKQSPIPSILRANPAFPCGFCQSSEVSEEDPIIWVRCVKVSIYGY